MNAKTLKAIATPICVLVTLGAIALGCVTPVAVTFTPPSIEIEAPAPPNQDLDETIQTPVPAPQPQPITRPLETPEPAYDDF